MLRRLAIFLLIFGADYEHEFRAADSSHPCTLFIGSEPLLAAWNARAKSVDTVIPVAHTDLSQALEMIGTRRPEVVVIEQAVAASGSGSALMARLHNERYERGIEIRLLPAERAADLMSSEPGDVHPQVWLSVLAEPLPARPQRRAARVRARDDEQAFIDGAPVTLLDVVCEWRAGAIDGRPASAAACSSGAAAGTRLGEDGGGRGVVDLRDRTHASVPRGHRVHPRDPRTWSTTHSKA